MMPNAVLQDFEALPPDAQRQVIDFIAFIKSHYQAGKDMLGKPGIETSFGAVKVKKRITLEQMDSIGQSPQ